MKTNELQAIYVMWLRQMKRFLRFKARIATMIIYYMEVIEDKLRRRF